MSNNAMLNDFIGYIEKNSLVREGDRVLLAVSGGIDSMVMADLFLQTEIKTGIAHCNFSLRGRESDMDEQLVRKYASRHKIPFYSIKFSTEDYARENGISVQMAARELRYEWFEKTRSHHGFDTVAVAHNLNDNAETLLINLTRGTGIAGLSGMKPVNKHIIRPLLFASREEIEEYCRNRNIKYREDKSNAETKYTRNKIRHLVMPLLKEINPSVETTISETATRLGEISDIVNKLTENLRKEIITQGRESFSFTAGKIKPYMTNRTLIYEIFKPFGISDHNLGDFYALIDGRTGAQIFTESHRILKNRNQIIVTVITDEKTESKIAYKAESTGDLKKIPFFASVHLSVIENVPEVSADRSVAMLDFSKLTFPLIIRNWNRGDFFYPLGMKQRKKLSDYFIDRKFSRIDKEKALILESDRRIVWIIGERIDDRFRISKATEKILVIRARE